LRLERLSVVIPALNEATALPDLLADLAPLLACGAQIIVADGGSNDGTLALIGASDWVDAPRGRARQMNAGAGLARGEVLWFVHADTRLPMAIDEIWTSLLADHEWQWGRFDVRLSGNDWRLKVIGQMINWRSRLSGIATGDQGLFVRRALFEKLGGFADLALMEDIELCKRLKTHAPALNLRQRLATSSRRWERRGIARTVGLMWLLRARYFFGADPNALARLYRQS